MQKPNPLKALALTWAITGLAAGLMLGPMAISQAAGPHTATVRENASEAEAHQCFLSQLDLSKEQSQKIKTIMAGGHKQSQALKSQLHAKKRGLMQYLQSPDANLNQALSQNNDINGMQRQLGELRLKTFFAMRAQLSPEQLQKLQHLQKERMSKHAAPGCGPHENPSHGQPKPDKHHP